MVEISDLQFLVHSNERVGRKVGIFIWILFTDIIISRMNISHPQIKIITSLLPGILSIKYGVMCPLIQFQQEYNPCIVFLSYVKTAWKVTDCNTQLRSKKCTI